MADFNARFGMGDSSDADDGQFPDFSEVDLTFEDKEEDLKPNRSSVVSSLREKAKTMRLTERRSVTERSSRSGFSSFWGRFISEPTTARTKTRDMPFNGIMPSSPCAETFPQKIQEPAKPRARAASVQHHRKTKRIGMVVSEDQIIAIPPSVGRIKNLARS
eukprot:TRINITY_DN14473_c0_g1_i2.p1 TRINITY_DN14473_c0_g1~~TRINITY_DN14473_c0_g1_i2.p1  ORF type:complete len:177 (-),score=19.08 TRINITY_DN14473_c0_g1_i2:20-502(-)